MKYCPKCGAELFDEATICPKCGVPQANSIDDSGSIGYGFLGFCIPIVGLVLFLIWKDVKPNNAKKAGVGALISFALGVLLYILYFVAFGFLLSVDFLA